MENLKNDIRFFCNICPSPIILTGSLAGREIGNIPKKEITTILSAHNNFSPLLLPTSVFLHLGGLCICQRCQDAIFVLISASISESWNNWHIFLGLNIRKNYPEVGVRDWRLGFLDYVLSFATDLLCNSARHLTSVPQFPQDIIIPK